MSTGVLSPPVMTAIGVAAEHRPPLKTGGFWQSMVLPRFKIPQKYRECFWLFIMSSTRAEYVCGRETAIMYRAGGDKTRTPRNWNSRSEVGQKQGAHYPQHMRRVKIAHQVGTCIVSEIVTESAAR
jgi:hypothetical protein